MKQKKIKSPMKLFVMIGDRDVMEDVEYYLNENSYNAGIIFMGKGTSESDMADIFGFGMSDKDIVACLLPTEKFDDIVRDLNDITRVDTDHYGLNFVIEPTSASSNMLEMFNFA